jgi:hypothetical protein
MLEKLELEIDRLREIHSIRRYTQDHSIFSRFHEVENRKRVDQV